MLINNLRECFVALVCRVPFRNNMANACGTVYVEVGDILYQALKPGTPIFSILSITNNPWFIMSSFDFSMDAEKRRHSINTHSKSSNVAASEGDRGLSIPTICNIYIYIHIKRIRCIVTVTWCPWMILKVVVATK